MTNEECISYAKKISLVNNILQRKWTLQVLCAIRVGPVRLSTLLRLIPSASKKGLLASLRSLESSKIVVRHDKSHTLLHVEYDFAKDMREVLGSILDQLAEWGGILEERQKLPKMIER